MTDLLKPQHQNSGGFDALALTEIILENSTAVLFRRRAADDPKKRKMVYVSPNIASFGYRAEDFLEGKMMFRDIVYKEDSDRTLKEIREFVEQGIDTYTQTYRIVTGSGEVRWVEDRTSVYHDNSTGASYHQGIVIDIHEQKKALQLAAEVQKSLLPERAPDVKGVEIAGRTFSCDEVGGDYYDYFTGFSNQGSVSIVIGDITGHGVDAALLMASARAFLRMRASQPGTVEEIVTSMNEQLTRDMEKTSRFMTLFYLHIERSSNSLEWVRAGHDPAMLYDPATDCFHELKGPGLALGVDKDFNYHQQQLDDLVPGQLLVLATDGIFEASNKAGIQFGRVRLQSIVRNHSTETAESILSRILKEHDQFTAGCVQEDDVTVIVVKILEDTAQARDTSFSENRYPPA